MLRIAILSVSFFCVSTQLMAQTLGEAVRQAIVHHPTALAEEANVFAVASEFDESRRSFSPTVEIYGDAAKQRRITPTSTSVSGAGGTKFSREIGIRAELLLFDGFERANAVYRNAARVDGALYRLLSASETLALSAIEAYVDVVRHRALVAAARDNLRNHRSILVQIKEKVAGETAPFSDQIQIEERVIAAEFVLSEVRNALADANAKFKKVVGHEPGDRLYAPDAKSLPTSKQALISASIANNYTIKQAEKVISEFEYANDGVRAGYMPRLSLEGYASAGEDRGGTDGDETDVYVGLTLSWRLFDGGQIMARERAASERVSEATHRLDVSRREVTELAARAWNALHGANEKNAIVLRQIASNNRIASSYREEYDLAKRSLLDVLDAEKAVFNNRFQQISIAASRTFASYRVLAAMSNLVQHFGIEPTAIAPVADFEEQITSSPSAIFDITIEPLQ